MVPIAELFKIRIKIASYSTCSELLKKTDLDLGAHKQKIKMLHNSDDVTSSVAEPEPVGAGTFFGRSRCKDVKAKTCYLLLFSLFSYEEEPEPVKEVPGAEAGQK